MRVHPQGHMTPPPWPSRTAAVRRSIPPVSILGGVAVPHALNGRIDASGGGDVAEPVADGAGIRGSSPKPSREKHVAVLIEHAAGLLSAPAAAFLPQHGRQGRRRGASLGNRPAVSQKLTGGRLERLSPPGRVLL